MNTNASGDLRHDSLDVEFAAFDRLPKALREAMTLGVVNWSSLDVGSAYRRRVARDGEREALAWMIEDLMRVRPADVAEFYGPQHPEARDARSAPPFPLPRQSDGQPRAGRALARDAVLPLPDQGRAAVVCRDGRLGRVAPSWASRLGERGVRR